MNQRDSCANEEIYCTQFKLFGVGFSISFWHISLRFVIYLSVQNHYATFLSAMEEKLANYRQFYNDTVLRYDRLLETVPTSLIAKMFHLNEVELPEFSVWREYMVYAVAMGNGQKVAEALAIKYPEAVSTGTDTCDDDIFRWLRDMALYDAMDSIGREVAEIKAPSSSSSGNSSDSGSGGDFIG